MNPFEIITAVLSLSERCYDIAQEVKSFKKSSNLLAERVKLLNEPIQLAKKNLSSSNHDYERFLDALKKLKKCIEDINAFLQKVAEMKNWKKFLQKCDITGNFQDFNVMLDGLVPGLILIMESEKREEFVRKMNKLQDTQETILNDVKQIALDMSEVRETVVRGNEEIKSTLDKILQSLPSKSIVPLDLKEINVRDLQGMEYQPNVQDGTFGELYFAHYRSFGVKVAVKKLYESQDIKTNLKREALILKTLESPFIVKLWGICTEGNDNMIVFEYMENGHLRKFLDKNSQLTDTQRLRMALDSALGLYVIHNQLWLHRNLTSMKYLVDNKLTVKLSDVGLSKTWESARKHSSVPTQAKRYHAPELLKSAKHVYDFQCEIYCFGIVLWEIFTGNEPYEGMSQMEVMDYAKNEKQLPIPDNFGSRGELILKCMRGDRILRPNINAIVDALKAIKLEDCEQKN
ncbi:mixed lineage kinase domain-like protein [Anneissia japonica]|uniref:mixed lineage kinase domain-like protein n=1 Tax=Anneissia japonica TaxID=1529436 RepID=UPI001425B12E|nr:mixed lineage kinase domain-like protein [Anneissia japonica]